MSPQCTTDDYERIEILIKNFCSIILTKSDKLNIEETKKYIDSLSDSDIEVLNTEHPETNQQIRAIVLKQMGEYIKSFFQSSTPNFQRPFEFDSIGTYSSFCEACSEYYRNKHQQHQLPPVLKFTLQYIQDMSEHYSIFGHFYKVHSKQTSDDIINKMSKTAEEKANAAVKNATEEAAKVEVHNAVENKMTEITKHISETSVTILGIFSGIVLTVVAGLFYSSSVLENVAKTNFFKLMFISALVGLVCFGLIVVMFRFIEKISGKTENKFFSDKVVISITVILCMVMTLGLGLHLVNLDKNNVANESATEASACVCLTDESTTE